jgi:hypothetical protein
MTCRDERIFENVVVYAFFAAANFLSQKEETPRARTRRYFLAFLVFPLCTTAVTLTRSRIFTHTVYWCALFFCACLLACIRNKSPAIYEIKLLRSVPYFIAVFFAFVAFYDVCELNEDTTSSESDFSKRVAGIIIMLFVLFISATLLAFSMPLNECEIFSQNLLCCSACISKKQRLFLRRKKATHTSQKSSKRAASRDRVTTATQQHVNSLINDVRTARRAFRPRSSIEFSNLDSSISSWSTLESHVTEKERRENLHKEVGNRDDEEDDDDEDGKTIVFGELDMVQFHVDEVDTRILKRC